MNRLVRRQLDHNAQTRNAWECFTEHRQRVTQLLVPPELSAGARLCVLGAGNSNDLELTALTAAYAEVHLVDLDSQALRQGVERQSPANQERIHLHGDRDLTGILEPLSKWDPAAAPDDGEIQRAIDAALTAPAPCEGGFTTVASVCLLSQLIHSVVAALGQEHPRFVDLIAAIRQRHLRLLADFTAPGGLAVLITDVVSSDTCPALVTVPPEELPALVRQSIDARNFFHGVNPAVIAHQLRSDPQLAAGVTKLDFIAPWRWDLGPRVYAVYAIRWRTGQTTGVAGT